ncbi:hypothetical protein C943_01958 [Mariniradius saccharolyticus AK6]|uniref:Uncharacterized protein n=1 Tax=Mariniradius saccharolyticus AK6 TaxID=1239962 RepID=M7XT53_9BACT|nr:hypothetical protein C943_01958 [Mariniradius saccharolyticus AK6]
MIDRKFAKTKTGKHNIFQIPKEKTIRILKNQSKRASCYRFWLF